MRYVKVLKPQLLLFWKTHRKQADKNMKKNPRKKTKRRAKKWTDEETDKLINLWSEKPVLFDTSNKDYFNQTERDKFIFQISNAFTGVTKKDIFAKMDSLRTYYSKVPTVIASKKSGAGTADIYKPKWTWAWYEQLSFLDDHLTPRRTQSNLKSAELFSSNENKEEDLGFVATASGPIYSGREPSNKSLKKLKLSKEDELISSAIEVMKKKEDPKTADALWGDQMGLLIQTISNEETKEYLKLEIQRMIFNARFQRDSQYRPRIPFPPVHPQINWGR